MKLAQKRLTSLHHALTQRNLLQLPSNHQYDRIRSQIAHFASFATPSTAAPVRHASSSAPPLTVDILIVGGGVVGSAMAHQLKRVVPHLSIGLVEAGAGPPSASNRKENTSRLAHTHPIFPDTNLPAQVLSSSSLSCSPSSLSAPSKSSTFPLIPHPRSYALSPRSLDLLSLSRSSLLSQRLGFYSSMQIWDAAQPAILVFDHTDRQKERSKSLVGVSDVVDDGTDGCGDYLGAVVEDAVIVEHLWQTTVTDQVEHVWLHTRVADVSSPLSTLSPVHVTLQQQQQQYSSSNPEPVSTATKTTRDISVQTRLLIAADGAQSAVRSFVGIRQSTFDYPQTALTCTVRIHPAAMKGRCFQRFLPTGSLIALLPTFSDAHAVVVWSTTHEAAQYWKHHPELVTHLNEQLQMGPGLFDPLNFSFSSSSLLRNLAYGVEKLAVSLPYAASLACLEDYPFVAPPKIEAIESPRYTVSPLSMRHASVYALPRLALVGDAAHTVHPLAGQGVNMGLRDVEQLVHVLEQAVRAGMDPSVFIEHAYGRARQRAVQHDLTGVHALYCMFGGMPSSDAWLHPVAALGQYVKSLGMNVVQQVAPLRHTLVRAACGD